MAKRELNKTAKWDGKTYDRRSRFYSDKSSVQKIAKEFRAQGFSAVIDKRKAGHFVWVSREKKAPRKGRIGGGGARNYKEQHLKAKGTLKKLARDYAQLSLPVPRSEASRLRKIARNYKSKKKLTPTQAKRLNKINKTLKKVKDVDKKDFELKVKITQSKKKVKELEKKMKEAEKSKLAKGKKLETEVKWDKTGDKWKSKSMNFGKTPSGFKVKGFIHRSDFANHIRYSVTYKIYSQKGDKWVDHTHRTFKMNKADDKKAIDMIRYNAPN